MESNQKIWVNVEAIINANIETVWKKWITPKDIIAWNAASDDWHTTKAENDLRIGGRFTSRMEAKDGSMGFDFGGTYTNVIEHKLIESTLDDERRLKVTFESDGNTTLVKESFEAETENSVELQQFGWQAILNNFKMHVERGE